ncbi:MAG: fatty acid desaturase [Deltaproteobacteria bacterium]|nr:fatty acid desaturase [Deltaproteobacteria bacterium]
MKRAAVFKYPDGAWRNVAAIGYASLGHALAIALLVGGGWLARLIGVGLAAHTLLIAAYLVHECIHETIFRDRRWNARLGLLMAWLGDGALAGYEWLRKKHLHHHLDRVDPLGFDYRVWLAQHPRGRRLVYGLEWAHVPAIELLLRVVPVWRVIARASDRGERGRVALVVGSRVVAALLLWTWSPLGAVLYGVAYLLFVVMARFADAFHHTFELMVVDDYDHPYGPPGPSFDRAYEDANTFSNVLSRRRPWLNLLVLNFSYHNAHHVKPGIPWHRLPALDAQLFGGASPQCLPMPRLLADFHAFRLARLTADQTIVSAADGSPRYVGAVAVSLLTV